MNVKMSEEVAFIYSRYVSFMKCQPTYIQTIVVAETDLSVRVHHFCGLTHLLFAKDIKNGPE